MRVTAFLRGAVATLVAVSCLSFSFKCSAQSLQTIALTGDPVPGGDGNFEDLGIPILNEQGQVVFFSSLSDTSGGSTNDSGYYRAESDGSNLTELQREGDPAPEGDGYFSDLVIPSGRSPAMDDSGRASFVLPLAGYNDLGGVGLYRSGGTITKLHRNGEVLDNIDGVIVGYGLPRQNNNGLVVFQASLNAATTPNGGSDDKGLFAANGTSVIELVREGQAAPDGNGMFDDFVSSDTEPAVNDKDQVAFYAELRETSGGTNDDSGLFLVNGPTITQIVREGDPAPDGNGVFSGFIKDPNDAAVYTLGLNDNGQVAFLGTLRDTSGGADDDSGVFLFDGTNVVQLVREGDPVPGGDGNFDLNFSAVPEVNANGQALLFSNLRNTGIANRFGIYLVNGTNGITQIVRTGDPAPDGDGDFFSLINEVAVNDLGQVVFRGSVFDGATTSYQGLFFRDVDGTMLNVAHTGMLLEGRNPFLVLYAGGMGAAIPDGSGRSKFNNSGQVAFRVSYLNGDNGIFLWSPFAPPPEISSIAFDGNDVVITIPSVVGNTYQLQRRSSAGSGMWMNEGTPVPGTGGEIELRHVGGAGSDEQYYVVVESTGM